MTTTPDFPPRDASRLANLNNRCILDYFGFVDVDEVGTDTFISMPCRSDCDADESTALDMRPILGEIARAWQQIQPGDLTAPQALKLLGVLTEIDDSTSCGRLE